jgi:predicted transcriptional regulator
MFNFPVRLASFKYRDRMTIFRDVLKTIERSNDGGRKYTLMKHASLSYDQLNKYLLFLTNMGYIKEMPAEPDGRKYEVTEKGSVFLRSLDDLRLHIHRK